MQAAHHAANITLWTLLGASVAMAVKDCLATLLVVAETRGKARLAGVLDGAGDLATLLVNIVGVGAVISYGWNPWTVAVLLVMMITSTLGTYYWTRLAQRINPQIPVVTQAEFESLQREVAELRRKAGT